MNDHTNFTNNQHMNDKHLDINRIKELVSQKYINVQKHPTLDLYIYNYSALCQYDKKWTPETLACRGLVMDGNNKIIARPFEKFFNYEEVLDKIPNEPFIALEKMDGSLGIIFKYNGELMITTRGSFISDQAIRARQIIEKYPNFISAMHEDYTFLAEIIFDDNRIVVDYNGEEKLVLLSIIHNETGFELPYGVLHNFALDMPLVMKYGNKASLKELQALNLDNKEGFVIQFESGYRVKVKFEEYCRLHRIVTCVSSITIWESLKAGESLDELLIRVPDEFYDFVQNTISDLTTKYDDLQCIVVTTYIDICEKLNDEFPMGYTKKQFAFEVFARAKNISGFLFAMHDNKDYSEAMWNEIRPKFMQPFKNKPIIDQQCTVN